MGKTVSFSDKITIHYVPSKNEEDRSTNVQQLTIMMRKCDYAAKVLGQILNKYSPHKVLTVNEESPIMVNDKNNSWYNDMSVINLYNMVLADQYKLAIFINEFNFIIDKHMRQKTSARIIYKSKLHKDYVICFPAITRD